VIDTAAAAATIIAAAAAAADATVVAPLGCEIATVKPRMEKLLVCFHAVGCVCVCGGGCVVLYVGRAQSVCSHSVLCAPCDQSLTGRKRYPLFSTRRLRVAGLHRLQVVGSHRLRLTGSHRL